MRVFPRKLGTYDGGDDLSPTTAGGESDADLDSFLTAIWNDQYTDNEIFNDIFPLRTAAVPPPPPPPPPPRVQQQQQETIASSFNDILPNIVALAEDQMGVKYLQSVLSMCSEAEYNVSLKALGSDLYRLSFHVYGNHVVQKLLEVGSTLDRRGSSGEYCRRIFGLCMAGHCVDLSLDSYGCRVIQRGLDYLYLKDKLEMLKELVSRRGDAAGRLSGSRPMKGNNSSTLLRLIEDQNGNHVVQKMVDRLPATDCAVIVDELLNAGDVVAISLHSYGCRVMQRVLEHCPHSITYKMLNKLQPGIEILIRDQFGNYVVQHILKYGRLTDKQLVVNLVVGNITYYSCHKYASNVVERCLEKYVPQQMRASIVLATFTPCPPNGAPSGVGHNSTSPGGIGPSDPCHRAAGKVGMKTTNFNNEFNRSNVSPAAQGQSPEAHSPISQPPIDTPPTDKSSIRSAGELLQGDARDAVSVELKVKEQGGAELATGGVGSTAGAAAVSGTSSAEMDVGGLSTPACVAVDGAAKSGAKDQSFFSGVDRSRNDEISVHSNDPDSSDHAAKVGASGLHEFNHPGSSDHAAKVGASGLHEFNHPGSSHGSSHGSEHGANQGQQLGAGLSRYGSAAGSRGVVRNGEVAAESASSASSSSTTATNTTDSMAGGKPPILSMIRDPYANYVVQKILASYDVLDLTDPRKREVFNKLQKHVPALKKFTYGKHIVEGIERLKKQIAEMPSANDPGLTVVSQR